MNNTLSPTFLFVTEMETIIGKIVLAKTDAGLCCLEFGAWTTSEYLIAKWSKRWFHNANQVYLEKAFTDEILQLEQYFLGMRTQFTLPLDLRGTSFQLRVWQALQRIAYGATVSYEFIAQQIASPLAVRAVGGALNRNPLPIILPCHRVAGKNGKHVGYQGGLTTKQQLLALEQS